VNVAVFVTTPGLEPGATRTLNTKVAASDAGSVATVQVTVPFVPTAGAVQVDPNELPMYSNSSSAGSTSVITTFVAASGPTFRIVIQ